MKASLENLVQGMSDCEKQNADLRAQIAEKDKALRKIAEAKPRHHHALFAVNEMRRIAESALAPQDSDKEATKGEQE